MRRMDFQLMKSSFCLMSKHCEFYHFTFIHVTDLNLFLFKGLHHLLSIYTSTCVITKCTLVCLWYSIVSVLGSSLRLRLLVTNCGPVEIGRSAHAQKITLFNWTTCKPSGPSFWSIHGHEHTRCHSRVLQFSY